MPNELKWKAGEVLAPEAPGSALARIDKMTPEEIFVPGRMDPILKAIKDEVDKQASVFKDMRLKADRDGLRSLSMRITKSKTFIESQRKSLVAAEKRRLAGIDAEGKRIWEILEGIGDDVRSPLTAWEQKDKDRIARHEKTLENLLAWGRVPFGMNSAGIRSIIDQVEAVDPSTCEEFAALATGHQKTSLRELHAALTTTLEVERQKAENEKLRAEAAERDAQERAVSAARYAREQAERDAEAKIQQANSEKQQAEDRAALAERRAHQAVEEERQRASEAEAAKKREADAREANEVHRKHIEGSAADAIVQHSHISRDLALTVVHAIVSGNIPNISIRY